MSSADFGTEDSQINAEQSAMRSQSGPANSVVLEGQITEASSSSASKSYYKLDAADWLKVAKYAYDNGILFHPSKIFDSLALIGVPVAKNKKAFAGQWNDRRQELAMFARTFFEQKAKDPDLGNTDEHNMPAIMATKAFAEHVTRWAPNPHLALRIGLYMHTKKAQALAKAMAKDADETIKANGSKYLDQGPAASLGTISKEERKALHKSLDEDADLHKSLRSKSQTSAMNAASESDRVKMEKVVDYARAKKRHRLSGADQDSDDSNCLESSSGTYPSRSVSQFNLQEQYSKMEAARKEEKQVMVDLVEKIVERSTEQNREMFSRIERLMEGVSSSIASSIASSLAPLVQSIAAKDPKPRRT